MQSSHSLDLGLAPWMTASSTQMVMRALGEDKARFVGGCVRDWILKKNVEDIDIATVLLPEDVEKVLKAAQIKWVPTGIEHGTITAVVEGKSFEITTLRRDVKTDGRRAVVAFTHDWAEDAARRDFTINTLLADWRGNIYDPLGTGLDDLEAKRMRFVGEPAERIAEDYLRILRYFRFGAQLGWKLDDDKALFACEAAAPRIADLSRERVTHEILRLLAAKQPADILVLMREKGILPPLLEDFDGDAMTRLISSHPLTRLLLLHDPEEVLVLSGEQKRFLKVVRGAEAIFQNIDEKEIKKLIYFHGNTLAFEIYALWCARNKKEPQAALINLVQDWQAPVFPVTGEELIAQGMKPGPDLGAELKRREEEWLSQL